MRNVALTLAAFFAMQFALPGAASALDHFKLLDLHVGTQQFTGRILTHNDDSCWFLCRDGRLRQIAMDKVTEFSEGSDRFKALSQIELKRNLQAEFGKNFEISTTSHYVVVARHGSADLYASIFDRIYREFVRSFSARGFEVAKPEFPLIAIVFSDRVGFTKYCHDEGVRVQPGLVGYYLPTSNRVAMFERPDATELDSTVIHEATHQVAFNTGIHSRLAKHPKWVVEGLATVFEAEGARTRQDLSTPADRINRERYLWFQEYAQTRRSAHSLASFLRDDRRFETATLDAYSEAWALSFFLIETRSSEYGKYLKQLVARDPLQAYDAESRLNDFTNAFGKDTNSPLRRSHGKVVPFPPREYDR